MATIRSTTFAKAQPKPRLLPGQQTLQKRGLPPEQAVQMESRLQFITVRLRRRALIDR